MRVFAKAIVLTTKPHIDATRSLYIKARLGGYNNGLRKIRIKAINSKHFPLPRYFKYSWKHT